MINALQSILKFDWNSLHAFEHQCALPFHLFFTLFFFSVGCLPQSCDVSLVCLTLLDPCIDCDRWM